MPALHFCAPCAAAQLQAVRAWPACCQHTGCEVGPPAPARPGSCSTARALTAAPRLCSPSAVLESGSCPRLRLSWQASRLSVPSSDPVSARKLPPPVDSSAAQSTSRPWCAQCSSLEPGPAHSPSQGAGFRGLLPLSNLLLALAGQWQAGGTLLMFQDQRSGRRGWSCTFSAAPVAAGSSVRCTVISPP